MKLMQLQVGSAYSRSCMAEKVMELHRTRDAVAVMVMSEVGELKAIFVTTF